MNKIVSSLIIVAAIALSVFIILGEMENLVHKEEKDWGDDFTFTLDPSADAYEIQVQLKDPLGQGGVEAVLVTPSGKELRRTTRIDGDTIETLSFTGVSPQDGEYTLSVKAVRGTPRAATMTLKVYRR